MSDHIPGPGVGDPSNHINPNLIMHETDEVTIWAQIEAGRERDGSLERFLENFKNKLPGGASRVQEGVSIDSPLWSVRTRQQLGEAISEKTRDPDFTLRMMFEDIDSAIAEEPRVDPDELKRLREAWETATGAAESQRLEEYLEYALPLYVRLRMKEEDGGYDYSHYDLWR